MSRPAASKPRTRSATVTLKVPTDRAEGMHRALVHTSLTFLFIAACAVGIFFMRRHVEKDLAFPSTPPKVMLKERPAWMTDLLAEQIIRSVKPAGAHSAFDHQLLVDVGQMLSGNPWIKQVKQVRRVFDKSPGDTVEIDCEYRAPIALVHWRDYFWLVDGDSVKLPEQFAAQQVPRIVVGRDRKMNIRIIEGVKYAPVESGRKWPGEDLAAGLEMVKLLYGQPFAEEIVKVDVSNFGGRVDAKEAQLVLGTRYDTQIRWGQPPSSKNFFIEVPAPQKLACLKAIWSEYGRVDAKRPWIDIRFDKVTYPNDAAQASGR